MIIRRVLAACLAWTFLSCAALADQPVIYASEGAAIDGYDVVAYFAEGKAVKGSRAHKVMWKGAVWYFASAHNRETFEANPRAYAPKYGGYCAYAMSLGRLASSDPTAWRIQDGRLYLNHNAGVREVWLKDVPGNVDRANANWPAVLSK